MTSRKTAILVARLASAVQLLLFDSDWNGLREMGLRDRVLHKFCNKLKYEYLPKNRRKIMIKFTWIAYNIQSYDILPYHFNQNSHHAPRLWPPTCDRGHAPRHAPRSVRYCVTRFCLQPLIGSGWRHGVGTKMFLSTGHIKLHAS